MLWPLEFRLEAGLRFIGERLSALPSYSYYIVPLREGILQETSTGEKYWRESPSVNDRLFEQLGFLRQDYHSIWNAVSLGLENSFWRGNKNNPALPVLVSIYHGIRGRMVRLEDGGDGFDYEEKLRCFFSGKVYAQSRGCGFNALHQEKLIRAGYEGRGNILNIAVLIAD